MFPKDFVWGVASSAYQVEGTDPDDGRGKNVWDEFVRSGRVYEQQTADVSCDHMHRYKEDFALMRLLGIKNYRFSLIWSRILPAGTGKVNEKAVQMYRDMILCMKENGIRPFITMFHWEFPYELFKKADGSMKMWWSGLENMQKSLQKISLICVPILSQSMSRSVRLDWDT